MLTIVAGSSHKHLSKKLADEVGLPCIVPLMNRSVDSEIRIEIKHVTNNQNAIIIQSASHNNLIELLLLADILKQLKFKKIISLVPYLGYARQDKQESQLKLISTLIKKSGINMLVTIDIHSKQSKSFFKIPFKNLDPLPLFLPFLRNDLVVVSPDLGGVNRAKRLGKFLKSKVIIINKTRKTNTCEIISGKADNKHCLIVDDIVETGFTLCEASKLLFINGAKSVEAVVTHSILSKNAMFNIANANIQKLIITNSIINNSLPSNFETIDISPLLKESILNIVAVLSNS